MTRACIEAAAMPTSQMKHSVEMMCCAPQAAQPVLGERLLPVRAHVRDGRERRDGARDQRVAGWTRAIAIGRWLPTCRTSRAPTSRWPRKRRGRWGTGVTRQWGRLARQRGASSHLPGTPAATTARLATLPTRPPPARRMPSRARRVRWPRRGPIRSRVPLRTHARRQLRSCLRQGSRAANGSTGEGSREHGARRCVSRDAPIASPPWLLEASG
jgi:hypothetical protein